MGREVIILAGGLGTRLRKVIGETPKPMAAVAGRPFLEHVLNYLRRFNFEHVILSVGYRWESIQSHFGDSFQGIKISYAIEKQPLGTGGAIKFAMEKCKGNQVMVLNGDTFFEVNLNDFYNSHNDSSADVSLVLRKVNQPDRYGTVSLNESHKVLQFIEKRKGLVTGLINGGVYLICRRAFESFKLPTKFSVEEEFFAIHLHSLKIQGFISDGYFIDIGVPKDYAKANEKFRLLTD